MICPSWWILCFCHICDECKYYDESNDHCAYCCCCIESLTKQITCEDNTMFSNYMRDVIYGRHEKISYHEYNEKFNIKNELINHDKEFMNKNQTICQEISDTIGDVEDDNENTPLLLETITIDD